MKLNRSDNALPREFLEWQVQLRRWTAETRAGAPHIGVAPLALVRRPEIAPGFAAHSLVCGLLPRADLLEAKTKDFRQLYESGIEAGARELYERGLEYLVDYYRSTESFDPTCITTLVDADSALARGLRADPNCALVFHVFEPGGTAPGGAMRTQQLACTAEVLSEGPVYENVWWHNALFHGFADGSVVIRFGHKATYDVRFGRLEPVAV